MKSIKRSDKMKNVLLCKSLQYTDRQGNIKSSPLLMISELRLFILSTSAVAKFGDKDLHSRSMARIKDWQFLNFFFSISSWGAAKHFRQVQNHATSIPNQFFRFYGLISSRLLLSICVWHRYLLAVPRPSNRD